MRWIVFSENPVALHLLIESAETAIPRTTPEVLIRCPTSDESLAAYTTLAQRFRVSLSFATHWKQSLLDILYSPAPLGEMERMTMLSAEGWTFSRRVTLEHAWHALRDTRVLGVSLLSRPKSAIAHSYKAVCLPTWNMTENDPALALNTIYRTNDILGPLSRLEYDSPDTLLHVVAGDATMRRRTRMVCFDEPAMLPCATAQDDDVPRTMEPGEPITWS